MTLNIEMYYWLMNEAIILLKSYPLLGRGYLLNVYSCNATFSNRYIVLHMCVQ